MGKDAFQLDERWSEREQTCYDNIQLLGFHWEIPSEEAKLTGTSPSWRVDLRKIRFLSGDVLHVSFGCVSYFSVKQRSFQGTHRRYSIIFTKFAFPSPVWMCCAKPSQLFAIESKFTNGSFLYLKVRNISHGHIPLFGTMRIQNESLRHLEFV